MLIFYDSSPLIRKMQGHSSSPKKDQAEFKLDRPVQSHGTKGAVVKVITNHVKFTNIPNKDIYMYAVICESTFTNKDTNKLEKREWKPRERKDKLDAVYKHLLSLNHRVYASGSIVLSWEADLEKVYSVPVGKSFDKETNQEVDYCIDVPLKYTTKHNLSKLTTSNTLDPTVIQELIQVCDIMIKFDPMFKRLVKGVGQFSTNMAFKIPDSHLIMLKGMQSTTKLSASHGILLNVDAKYHLIFQEMNLLESFNKSKLHKPKDLQSEYKGLKVKIQANTTKRKNAVIVGVSELNANTFKIKDLDNISVFEYFKSKGILLKHPNAPLILVNKKMQTHYPPELLQIVANQSYDKPIPDINSIRRETCLDPRSRLKHIEGLISNQLFQIDKASEISASNSFLQIPARFLQPASVSFYNEVRKQGPNGSIDTRDAPFDKPCTIKSFAVLNFSQVPFRDIDRNLLINLQRVASKHGIQFPKNQPPYVECHVDPRAAYINYEENVEKALKEAYNKANSQYKQPPSIIICITPSATCHVYNHLKRLTETTSFLPTICLTQFVLADKFKPFKGRVTVNAQYCSNLLLKMNEKLSFTHGQATNAWRLTSADLIKFISKPTMVVGIDVCHGNEVNQRNAETSVCTFVGSVDSRFTDYRGIYKHCKHEDTSSKIKEAIKELFHLFKDASHCYPQTLIVYRDGLSQGEFDTVAANEIYGLRAAAQELGFEFELLYISCIKRHTTRFFATDQRNINKRTGNFKNGLVVDKEITGKWFEFYIQSHTGLQGTAIPTRYVVLHDDMHINGDDLQQFTLNMCGVLQRSAAPCSIPNVVKMADLLADRVKRWEKTDVVGGDGIRFHPELVKRSFYL